MKKNMKKTGEKTVELGKYPSSNGKDTIVYYVYKPYGALPMEAESDLPPRAILQISHGMCEYLERYQDFAAYLNDRGILVCGNDHLGHGASAALDESFGYFAEKDGWQCLVEDVHTLTLRMKDAYPGIPYFLLGHSMGSFVARAYLSRYGDEISGAILMGTSGKNRLAPLALPVALALKKVKGGHYRSAFLNHMAFGTYNVKCKPLRTPYDWISKDEAVVDKYNGDKRCTFIFTISGFLDLFYLLEYISKKQWATEVPVELPVFLMSGSMDPVGAYGKGVKEVHDSLAFAGIKDLRMKLYPGCRHEILNETNRIQVYEDTYAWIEKRILGSEERSF